MRVHDTILRDTETPQGATAEGSDLPTQVVPRGVPTRAPVPGHSEMANPTGLAATCASPLPPAASPSSADQPPGILVVGDTIDDFEILDVLGKGAFGVVYLARQRSLARQVALKVTEIEGVEGRTLAQLEHAHIVQVFSETADATGQRRLLCMQFVPGANLQSVLAELQGVDRPSWTGGLLLETVDRLNRRPALYDPQAARERQALYEADWAETVCTMGIQLAAALSHAHRHGVIHRDIKPGNILVSQYGRAMLADFNLAFMPLDGSSSSSGYMGGTLAYMAPEHLEAFLAPDAAAPEAVNERSDIYSLGAVLFEAYSGEHPFPMRPQGLGRLQALEAMANQRRTQIPQPPADCPNTLAAVIRKCLHPDPQQRYATADDLAQALEGCREHWAAVKQLAPAGRGPRAMREHPFRWLALFGLVPNILGSIVNISYNQLRIVSHLTEAQQTAFMNLVVSYNALAYPVLIWLAMRIILPTFRTWRTLQSGRSVAAERIDSTRGLALSMPRWTAALAALGWFPGGVLFPLGLHIFSGPIPGKIFAHFFISFTISGMIALVYSTLLIQCLVLCAFYPRLWAEPAGFRQSAKHELQSVPLRARGLQVLAGLIPLVGAIVLLFAGPEEFTRAEFASFRLLVVMLIGLGMLGLQASMMVARLIHRSLAALSGEAH